MTDEDNKCQSKDISFIKRKSCFLKKNQTIPNQLVFDSRLSSAALHLLLALNALPENWTIRRSDIKKRLEWGREKFDNAVKCLVKNGYMKTTQNKTPDGRFVPTEFEFDIYPINSQEECLHNECEPLTGFPTTDNPTSENTHTNNVINNDIEEELKDNDIEHRNIKQKVSVPPCQSLPSYQKKNDSLSDSLAKKFKLTPSQTETFEWLLIQNINTSTETLSWWAKNYSLTRIKEVVAYSQKYASQTNLGGYIQKILKSNVVVPSSRVEQCKRFAEDYKTANGWANLEIFQKYAKINLPNGSWIEITFERDPEEFAYDLMNKHQI